jgi:hypothetical protein
MADQTQIINMALTKLGEQTISNIGQDTPTATKVRAVYDQILDEVLLNGPEKGWKFIKEEVGISVDATSPTNTRFEYRYALPADFLRIEGVYVGGLEVTDWERKGQFILTNQESDEIVLDYLKRVTNTGLFPPYFTNYFYLSIAYHLSYNLVQNKRHSNALFEEVRIAKRIALTSDEQDRYIQESSSSWVDIGNSTSTLE